MMYAFKCRFELIDDGQSKEKLEISVDLNSSLCLFPMEHGEGKMD